MKLQRANVVVVAVTCSSLIFGCASWLSADEELATSAVAILQAHCFKCHSGDRPKSSLRLTSRGTMLAGGDYGAVVDLEHPNDSSLLAAVRYEDLEMPPSGKLADEQIEVLQQWVAAGVPFPKALSESDTKESPASQAVEVKSPNAMKSPPAVDSPEARSWWAYKPVSRPAVPTVCNSAWVLNPIDAFILVKLEAASLHPAQPATAGQLVRRIYYDIQGLPPSPDDLRIAAKFHARGLDQVAYRELVDGLLETAQYGEQWGRHWLDLARYAESNGYERDGDKPNAWRYRDYVIQSFNEDKPYDQFVIEQLAGDEWDPSRDDAHVATGFQRLGLWDDEPVDADAAYFDALDDVVSTTSQVFLGMTIGCARCHDHKLDPLLQRDYYSFLAFFRNTLCDISRGEFKNTAFTLNTQSPLRQSSAEIEAYRAKVAAAERKIAKLQPAIDTYEGEIEATFTSAEQEDAKFGDNRTTLLEQKREAALNKEALDKYLQLLEQRDKLLPGPPPSALCIAENTGSPPKTTILLRGNVHAEGDEVQPAYPTVLGFATPTIVKVASPTCGRRLTLAKWMVDPSNPLTARVMVNRIWQHHFGRGIVASSSDFGWAGERPTHPELLDWLAAEFVEAGWSVKHIHRLILSSNTYQMSAVAQPDAYRRDPDNELFSRFQLRRLSAEEIYDSVLAVSGRLSLRVGGPSVYPRLPAEALATASRPDAAWGESDADSARRRAIYIKVRRSLRPPLLAAFDTADTDTSCPVRFTTTVPTQALTLLNSDFIAEHAKFLAARLRAERPENLDSQLTFLGELTLGRVMTVAERSADKDFVQELMEEFDLSEVAALEKLCLTALNANEFLFVD